MKPLAKAVIGLSAAGAVYVGVQKIRHGLTDEAENRVEIHGFVSRGYEPVREVAIRDALYSATPAAG